MVARAEWIALSLGATASALRDLGAHWESGVAATGALALWDSQHKRCTRAGAQYLVVDWRARQASRLCAASSRADASLLATEQAGARRVVTSCNAAEPSQLSFNSGCWPSLLQGAGAGLIRLGMIEGRLTGDDVHCTPCS
jgi:hypothetical protein